MSTRTNGQGEELVSVDVQYRLVDGWHVFTSDEIFGLYVASQDPEKAYEMLVPAVEDLLRFNEGLVVHAEPTITLQEFLARHHRNHAEEQPVPASIIGSRRFLIRSTA